MPVHKASLLDLLAVWRRQHGTATPSATGRGAFAAELGAANKRKEGARSTPSYLFWSQMLWWRLLALQATGG